MSEVKVSSPHSHDHSTPHTPRTFSWSEASPAAHAADQADNCAHTTFDLIKARIIADKDTRKHKIRTPRLFSGIIVKGIVDANKKHTRSLNTRSLVRIMERELRKHDFDQNEINQILREYKMKLKEGPVQQGAIKVKNAASFFDYINQQVQREDEEPILKLSHEPSQHRKIANKFLQLDRRAFEEIDKIFVRRFAGKEKSVYVHGNLAVSTAKTAKDQKVLEKEYEMTVDIRVNAMRDCLKEGIHLEGTRLTDKQKEIILILYRDALEGENAIKNASSFFQSIRSQPGLYHQLFNTMDFHQLENLGHEIDRRISGIDTERKKMIDNGITFYQSARALSDLKDFLSSDTMKHLSFEQFTELMDSFDHLQVSIDQAKLLHGDIKPDNIFVYEETRNGRTTYTLKISDFGKSQLNVEKQRHSGNPRYHKGFHDTRETQQDSLNMLKLMILSSSFRLAGSAQDEEAYKKLVKNNPKISDIAFGCLDLGHVLHKEGITQYNYFTGVTNNVVATVRDFCTTKADEEQMRRNTETVIVNFFNHSSLQSDDPLKTIKKRMIFELIDRKSTRLNSSHWRYNLVCRLLLE